MVYIYILYLLIIIEGIWVNARSCYIMATDRETAMGIAINVFAKNAFGIAVKLYFFYAMHKLFETDTTIYTNIIQQGIANYK